MLQKLRMASRKFRVGHSILPFLIGGLATYLLSCFLPLITFFGGQDSYVYYYAFSTIVQGFVALVAFLGTLAVFKLQRDQGAVDRIETDTVKQFAFIDKIVELKGAMRELTIKLKTFAVSCLFDVALALVGIVLIPYFEMHLVGPIYLIGNIALSLWVLRLSYPIVESVLRLTPEGA